MPYIGKAYISSIDCQSRPISRDRTPDHNGRVIDPYDLKPRPFFKTVGLMAAFAQETKRLVTFTLQEDEIWRAQGRKIIAAAEASGAKSLSCET